MKMVKILFKAVLAGILGWGFTVPIGICQLQSPAREDTLVNIAPKSIQDSCREAERKFRIFLARFSPKELRDTTFLRKSGLRVESFWTGNLGLDSAEYAVIYYRCFESSYLTIFKKNPKQKQEFLWQSSDFGIGVKLGRLGEPEDVNNDGTKEIFFYHPERNAMDTTLELYGWDGKTAYPIGRVTGNSLEIKDVTGDGLKEIIANHNRYIWNHLGDTLVTESEFYRWNGKAFQQYDSKKTSEPVKD